MNMMTCTGASRPVFHGPSCRGPHPGGRGGVRVHAAAEAARRARPAYVPHEIADPNYVRMFDTTLRDGEQSPGATLTSKEKMEIAKQLSKLGVDIIEAGFPQSSPDDFEAVRSIAMEVGNNVVDGYVPVICGLARCRDADLERSWDAVRHAHFPRVHYFLATSPIHMEHKLRMSEAQVLEAVVRGAAHLRALGCADIEFSAEDATRTDPGFLMEVLSAAIEAGATTINIPDTTGWALPHEFGDLIARVRREVRGADRVVISTHCQNDLGLSTANSLAGAHAGARQIEGTINGIGERAGNASLEEVIMAVRLRGDAQLGGLWTGANPVHIAPTSKMVMDFSGMPVQPHKAIVGANAFAHESGIHQDGMLKSRDTYEIMTPESVGIVRADPAGLVLGKHSGRHALATRLRQLGVQLGDTQINDVFKRFKDVADKKKNLTDEDIMALVSDEVNQIDVLWSLVALQVVSGTTGMPTATVRLCGPDGITRVASCVGVGPVDAAYKVINSVVRVPCDLVDFSMNAVTSGMEALATTRVVVRPSAKLMGFKSDYKGAQTLRAFSGTGADEDIIVSAARAYIAALNKMVAFVSSQERHAREGEAAADEAHERVPAAV